MLKGIAIGFGVITIILGILGFVHNMTQPGELLGLFQLNGFHFVIYSAAGIVALCAGFANKASSKIFFQVFGVVFALLAVFGFFYGNQKILGLISNNSANTYLHIFLAIIALSCGFFAKKESISSIE